MRHHAGARRIRDRSGRDLAAEHWTEWFRGTAVTLVDNGEMVLSGFVAGQTALHGQLARLRDLALPLVSVHRTG